MPKTTDKSFELKAILVLVACISLFHILTVTDSHYWGGDFSLYIHHAKNIVEGKSYSDTGYIYNPYIHGLSPRNYPPGFPLLLTPIYRLFGLNFISMKLLIVATFSLFLITLYFLNKQKKLPFTLNICVLFLLGLSPIFYILKNNIISTIPFLLLSYMSFFAIEKKSDYIRLNSNEYKISFLIGILVYLSYSIRSIGIVFIPAILALDILKFRTVRKSTLISVAVFLGFYLLQNYFVNTDSYYDDLKLDFGVYIYNIFQYLEVMVVSIFFNGYDRPISAVILLVASLFAGVAYIHRVRTDLSIFEIFIPMYLGIIILWPSNGGIRFLVPLIPMFFFYLLIGIEMFISRPKNKHQKQFVALLFLAIFSSYTSQYIYLHLHKKEDADVITRKETVALFNYIESNTAKDDVFIFRKPRVLALFTGRNCANYALDAEKQLAFMKEAKVTYLVQSYFDDPEYREFIALHQNALTEEFRNRDFIVYKWKPDVL